MQQVKTSDGYMERGLCADSGGKRVVEVATNKEKSGREVAYNLGQED